MKKLNTIIAILSFLCISITINAQDFSANAKAEMAKNNFLPAIDELTAMLATNPNNETVLMYRANFYNRSGQNDKAITDAAKVLSINPKNVNALVVSGSAKAFQQKYKEAITDLSTALTLQPNLEPALMLRAQAYFKNKDYQKAIADLDTAIKNDPKQMEAYIYRARIAVDQNDFAGAIADYTFVTKNAPQNSKAYDAASKELLMTQERYLKLEKEKTMQQIAKSIEPEKEDNVDRAIKKVNQMGKDIDAAILRSKPILDKFSKYSNDLTERLNLLPKDDYKGRAVLYKEINAKMTTSGKEVEQEIEKLKDVDDLSELRITMQQTLVRVNDVITRTRPYAARYYQYVEQVNAAQKLVVDSVKKCFTAYDQKDQSNFATYKKDAVNSLTQIVEIITTAKADLSKFNDSQFTTKDDARMTADLNIYTKKLAEVKATNL